MKQDMERHNLVANNSAKIFYHADIEGNYESFFNALTLKFPKIKHENIKSTLTSFFAHGGIIILGGDYCDAKKNGDDMKLMTLLKELAQINPDSIRFILGNRDVNKLRFFVEDPDQVLMDEVNQFKSQKHTNEDDRWRYGRDRLTLGLPWTDNQKSDWFIKFLQKKFNLNQPQAVVNQFNQHSSEAKAALYRQWALANTMGAAQTWESMLEQNGLKDSSLEDQNAQYEMILENMKFILQHGEFHIQGPNFDAQHGALGSKFSKLIETFQELLGRKRWASLVTQQVSVGSRFPEADAITALFKQNLQSVFGTPSIKELMRGHQEQQPISTEEQLQIRLYDLFQALVLPSRGQEFIVQHHWSQVRNLSLAENTLEYAQLFSTEMQDKLLITAHTPNGDLPAPLRLAQVNEEGELQFSRMIVRADTSARAELSPTPVYSCLAANGDGWFSICHSETGKEHTIKLDPTNKLQGVTFDPSFYPEEVSTRIEFATVTQILQILLADSGQAEILHTLAEKSKPLALTYAGYSHGENQAEIHHFYQQTGPELGFKFIHLEVNADDWQELSKLIETFQQSKPLPETYATSSEDFIDPSARYNGETDSLSRASNTTYESLQSESSSNLRPETQENPTPGRRIPRKPTIVDETCLPEDVTIEKIEVHNPAPQNLNVMAGNQQDQDPLLAKILAAEADMAKAETNVATDPITPPPSWSKTPTSYPKTTVFTAVCATISAGAAGFGLWATLTHATIGATALNVLGLTVLTGIVWPAAIATGLVAVTGAIFLLNKKGYFDCCKASLFSPSDTCRDNIATGPATVNKI